MKFSIVYKKGPINNYILQVSDTLVIYKNKTEILLVTYRKYLKMINLAVAETNIFINVL